MRGVWSETNWRLDNGALVLPNGHRIALDEVRQWQTNRMIGQYDLTGKYSGWRIRQQWLIAPGGSIRRGRIAQHVLAHLVNAEGDHERELARRQLALF